MASNAESDPITRYSKTQRIILLIDLDPLLHNPNHNHYTKRILSFAETLLTFPSLSSSSLFSFNLFFSSLSPLLSSSKLPLSLSTPSLSFDHASSTLTLLSHTLSSLPQFAEPHCRNPNASHVAANITQILHHYPWDPHSLTLVPPNLVLLVSPSFCSLNSFFEKENGVVDAADFSRVFGGAGRALRSRGIHLSWIGVDVNDGMIKDDEVSQITRLFKSGIGKLGWGFCSVDSIVLGSALVPFGLIYPKIGISWNSIEFGPCYRKGQVQLSLGILDVSGNPIDYNCCDLEFVDLRVLDSLCEEDVGVNLENLQGGGCERKERIRKVCSDGIAKLEVVAVRRRDAFVNLEDCFSDSILVREVLGESKKKCKGGSGEFFADKALEILASEFDHPWQRKSVPAWEILLSFLYREGFWALVCVKNGNGDSCMGVLRPFTVFSALLSVLGDQHMACDFGVANVGQNVSTVDGEIRKSDRKFNKEKDLFDSGDKKSAIAIEDHQKRKIMDLNTLQSLTWSSFCNSAYDQFETDLIEVYYAIECNKLKKLKFLKCWMKQMKKSSRYDLTESEKPKPGQIIAEEDNAKSTELAQNDELPVSFASAEIKHETSTMQGYDHKSETSEAFFGDLSDKIRQGIESEVIDLGAFAERLVSSCIYWLRQKVDKEAISRSHSPLKGHDACGSLIVSELIKLLLREPKKRSAKHKGRNSFSQEPDPGPTALITEHVVREYELQILFRMEILQSEVGSGVEDSSKQKFVKQICMFLDHIRCHTEEGFFGGWNLENYLAKIIKSRYSQTLEEVVHKIYREMDLLPYAGGDEAPDNLLSSEDSYKSLNKTVYRDRMGENDVSNEYVSTENEPCQLRKNASDDHDKKLIEARERRDRARRFSSFTSWMPDLQRVWAPKQKGVKPKADPLRKLPKSNKRQRASYDTVCETPMTGNKSSSPWTSSDDDNRSQTCGSVPKVLFKDDLSCE